MAGYAQAGAREREEARDGLDVRESDLMGGGDDFATIKARMTHSREKRESAKEERLRELQQRETQKTADFYTALGVDLGKGPIRIAPRPELAEAQNRSSVTK